MSFFELSGPRDLLEKAKRELRRLEVELHVDHVYNFFVTAYHIRDYAEKTSAVPQRELEDFLKDRELLMCRDICDKGKHFRLTKSNRTDPTTIVWDASICGAPIGVLPLAAGETWMAFTSQGQVDVCGLAANVIQKWELFLARHGL